MPFIDFVKDNAARFLPQKRQPGIPLPVSTSSGGIGNGMASFEDEVRVHRWARLPARYADHELLVFGSHVDASIQTCHRVLRSSDLLQFPRDVLLRVRRVLPIKVGYWCLYVTFPSPSFLPVRWLTTYIRSRSFGARYIRCHRWADSLLDHASGPCHLRQVRPPRPTFSRYQRGQNPFHPIFNWPRFAVAHQVRS